MVKESVVIADHPELPDQFPDVNLCPNGEIDAQFFQGFADVADGQVILTGFIAIIIISLFRQGIDLPDGFSHLLTNGIGGWNVLTGIANQFLVGPGLHGPMILVKPFLLFT